MGGVSECVPPTAGAIPACSHFIISAAPTLAADTMSGSKHKGAHEGGALSCHRHAEHTKHLRLPRCAQAGSRYSGLHADKQEILFLNSFSPAPLNSTPPPVPPRPLHIVVLRVRTPLFLVLRHPGFVAHTTQHHRRRKNIAGALAALISCAKHFVAGMRFVAHSTIVGPINIACVKSQGL